MTNEELVRAVTSGRGGCCILSCCHECDCGCHRDGSVHIMACCGKCELCGKNIREFLMEAHKRDCHSSQAR